MKAGYLRQRPGPDCLPGWAQPDGTGNVRHQILRTVRIIRKGRWAAESNARQQIASVSDVTLGNRRNPGELLALVRNKATVAMHTACHETLQQSCGQGKIERVRQLFDEYGQDLNPARQTVILEQISEEPIHDRMKYLFESFRLYSVLDAD